MRLSVGRFGSSGGRHGCGRAAKGCRDKGKRRGNELGRDYEGDLYKITNGKKVVLNSKNVERYQKQIDGEENDFGVLNFFTDKNPMWRKQIYRHIDSKNGKCEENNNVPSFAMYFKFAFQNNTKSLKADNRLTLTFERMASELTSPLLYLCPAGAYYLPSF